MSRNESSQRLEPFGMRAVRLGLVSVHQVEKALAVQKMLDKNGQHQPIGMILVDLEMLTTTQLLAVLHSYDEENRERELRES
ncbi:MAG TPA: hypothetical protein VEK08_03850 [Planctomycetota bacterium]|nr:hypothetical protein [Planctomycetota bacterium]